MKNYDISIQEIDFIKEMIEFLKEKECDSQVRYWCRRIGYPNGIVYYNSGSEPDMSCKDCGEDLG